VIVTPCTDVAQPRPAPITHEERLALELADERDRYAEGRDLAEQLVALALRSLSPPPRTFLEHVMLPALLGAGLLPEAAPPGHSPSRRDQADVNNGRAFRRIGERDGFRCRICGADRTLTVDHVIAVANGGTDDDGNLQLLCRSHNSQKGAR
jgi:hypothetical protein